MNEEDRERDRESESKKKKEKQKKKKGKKAIKYITTNPIIPAALLNNCLYMIYNALANAKRI